MPSNTVFNRNELFAAASDAAERAGTFVMSRFHSNGKSIEISKPNLLLEVDAKAEEIIRFRLDDETEHGFSGKYSSNINPQGRYVWLVDALNGALNYSRRIPHFASSIALLEDGNPVFGLIRNHFSGEAIAASRNCGAFCSDVRQVVSSRNLLSSSIAALYPGRKEKQSAKAFDNTYDFISRMSETRVTGSISLDLCYLATGRLDIVCGRNVEMESIAAGMLIAKEAGAVFSFSRNNNKTLNLLAVAHKLERELTTSLPEFTVFSDDLPGFSRIHC